MKNRNIKLTIILAGLLIWSSVNVTAISKGSSRVTSPGEETGISVEKLILCNTGELKGVIDANIDDTITFSIVIENTGNTTLNIKVVDTMPIDLEYNGTIRPREPDTAYCSDDGFSQLIWYFNNFASKSTIEIRYKAIVASAGEFINKVNVEGSVVGIEDGISSVSDSDEAVIKVIAPEPDSLIPNIKVEKYVRLENQEGYEKNINANIDDRVVYKIIVTNNGDVTLLNIGILDKLPDGSVYISELITSENLEVIDDYNLLWVFEKLRKDESITIEFISGLEDTGNLENIVEVTAVDENNNEVFQSDNTSVNVEPLVEDSGDPDEDNGIGGTGDDDTGDGENEDGETGDNGTGDDDTGDDGTGDGDTGDEETGDDDTGDGDTGDEETGDDGTGGTGDGETGDGDTGDGDTGDEETGDDGTGEEDTNDESEDQEDLEDPPLPDDDNEEPEENEDNPSDNGYTIGENTDSAGPSTPANPNDNQESNSVNSHSSGAKKQDFSQYFIIGGSILLVIILLLFLFRSDDDELEEDKNTKSNENTTHYPYIPKPVYEIIDSKQARTKNQ